MKFISRILHCVKNYRGSISVPTASHLAIRPGQILNSRYRIVKQLGSGQHSTVWLAQSDGGLKALKILTDEVTAFQGNEAFELEVLKSVASAQSGFSKKRLLQLEDYFNIHDNHADYLCLVTAPLGPSLLQVCSKFESKRLPPQLVKRVTRQLLEALHVLHDQCQTVHTDIKPDNIMLNTAPLSETEEINLDIIHKSNFVLADLGTAIPPSGPHSRLIQPEALRAPEVITGCLWDVKADIWNLGCIVFELLIGQHLFKPKAGATWSAEQYHLARIFGTAYTKPLPLNVMDCFRRGQHFEKYFDDRGLRISAEAETVDMILQVYNLYTPELGAILTAMLQILPDARPSAKDLLAFDWLREEVHTDAREA
ncbi:kinase-like domain-containing protein [Favolaschia claudopus]|uniref:Kinase-like domain-containing protein n=1 Tax=Favolaschia claudopus TaxID=2862362 RepID=A0AAW0EIW6_9AGAR